MLDFRLGGVCVHNGGNKTRHIDGFRLYGNRIAGKRILLNTIDISLYSIGNGKNQRDADNSD